MKQAAVLTIVSSSLLLCSTNAFSVLNKKNQLQQQRTSSILRAEDSDEPEKKIGLSGLLQLITAGMGSPFLGVSEQLLDVLSSRFLNVLLISSSPLLLDQDFEGVDEETGKFMFSLEANNLVDEDGESMQTKGTYFESGWVDEEEEARKKSGSGFKFPWDK